MIIWLASYPRSGNTFFRVLLKTYYGFKTYSLYDNDAYLVKNLGFHEEGGEKPLPMDLSSMIAAKEIFFVKTHDLPTDESPAIYLVRDGRDALISYAHYVLSFEKDKAGEKDDTPERAFYKTLHDLIVYNASFGGWGPNVLTWAKRKAPTVVIRFEELVGSKDPIAIVQNALATLGLSERLPLQHDSPPSFEELHQKMPTFFREGKVGGWREKMPPELLDLFWAIHGDAMKFMGYPQESPKPNIPADLEEKLLKYEFELREKDLMLREKSLELMLKEQQLIEKEKIIQAFRNSPQFWLSNGPLYAFPFLERLVNIRKRFKPKLGVYHQYPPRQLNLPEWYNNPSHLPEADLPLISIVTPSYNQADYLERTIKSVLSQGYPKLEYVIQDGNSTDGSAAILEKYRAQLKHAESIPDSGQANAINLGVRHTSGEIMAYLNSDDMFLPGALHYVARYFVTHPDVDVVYGHRIIVDENDQEVGIWVMPPHDAKILEWADYVPQETMFWRRRIWEKSGGKMDETFQFALDWDLLIRFQLAGAKIVRLPRFLAAFRVHGAQKSTSLIHQRGIKEMNLLRERIHRREVSLEEVRSRIRPYLQRSLLFHYLYRLGILRY